MKSPNMSDSLTCPEGQRRLSRPLFDTELNPQAFAGKERGRQK